MADSTTPEQAAARALARAMAAGAESTRAALERLFVTARVTLDAPEPERIVTPPEPCLGIAFDVVGPLGAHLALVVPESDARTLAAALLGTAPGAEFDGAARAAVTEMANIVASSFLNGLAKALAMTLVPSVPHLIEDATRPLVEARQSPGIARVAAFSVALASGAAGGTFVVAMSPTSLPKLVAALGG
jgi:chemotaxis protein CheY-P-specific phosphatase CheC